MKFGTKAETLERLRHKVKTAKILPLTKFTIGHWMENQEECCKYAASLADKNNTFIVRSSALNEDTCTGSQAGKYDSVLHVANNKKEIIAAVDQVISSFGENNIENQIFIQPMLDAVKCSGVAFTIEPNTGGNYYVINYDDKTGATNSVTSGTGTEMKLFYQFKGKDCSLPVMSQVCRCLKELEDIMDQANLDVEFAITKEEILYILQVRPLCVGKRTVTCEEQKKALNGIWQKIKNENTYKPFLHGRRVIYGVMPDWNPAEIIGIKPNPLALSLYKEIITDNIWAYQRDNYGYKNLRSFPLLIDFAGLPYIDVRVSFNSFIPKALNDGLSEKLVNYYLDRLEERPDLHDKIEFEIAFTCYTLDLPERIKQLSNHGFSQGEIEEISSALREMTNLIIDNEDGLWRKDYQKIEYLKERYKQVVESDLNDIAKIYWLLEDCKRYGTLPFAGLARAGFIAVQLLKSMVNKKIITEKDYQCFMGDLNTVNSIMNQDMKQLSAEAFLEKYGHLRPGTYNILSKRYDEAPELYFKWPSVGFNRGGAKTESTGFRMSLKQMNQLKASLYENQLPEDILGIFHFIKVAIEGREFAKFIFTRNLSKAIQIFEKLGKEIGYSAEECALADISVIRNLYASSLQSKELFRHAIEFGASKYRMAQSIVLPPILCSERDVYSFHYPDTQPNYITLKSVTAETAVLENDMVEIENKIVLMPSADPGYDWIFSHHIKGFITKYGGANSHMAIRANELQMPAVIGTGDKLYEELIKAETIEINAMEKKVNVLK